jgi:hypothetical protein
MFPRSYFEEFSICQLHAIQIQDLVLYMLSFAKNLFRPSVASSKDRASDKLECEFFVLDGGNWQSLADQKCEVLFVTTSKGKWAMRFECPDESVSETILLETVTNLARFTDDESGAPCFQWLVRKGKTGDDIEEFGIRFTSDQQATEFATQISALGQKSADVVFECSEGNICLVERVTELEWEVIEEEVLVRISKTSSGRIEHYLTILNTKPSGDILFHSVISTGLQIEYDDKNRLVIFLGFSPMDEDVRVLGIQFESDGPFEDLKTAVKSAEPKTRRTAAPTVAQEDVIMWEAPEENTASPVKSRRTRRAKVEDSYENLHLETGRSTQRAIVFSKLKDGGSVGGFRVFQPKGDSLEALAGFQQITTGASKSINPKAVMIHEQDSKVLLLDPSYGRDKILELDLERGSIVQEWTPGMGMSVDAILPVSEGAQATGEKTFLGMNERALFVMDPRVNTSDVFGNRVRSFNYATNVKMACAATDAAGHIATGSKSGQIRLFDGEANREGELKRAKTLLQGLGDPISHVDVTADGEWLLGTCGSYLLLLNTEGGYTKSISKTSDEPVSLSLDWKDVSKHGLKTVQFTPARFDESRGLIVSSTGSLAVVWDFAKIKKSGTVGYSIKPMKDFIIDTHVLGNSDSVVAMYSDRVDIAKTTLKRK